MPNAHCVCPEFISNHISDPLVFNNVFIDVLISSDDQIILDREGRLINEYTESVKDNVGAYELLKAWQTILNGRKDGKVLLASSLINGDATDVVFDLITKAPTTFDKRIITHDNTKYERYINELNRQRISLYNLQNLTPSVILDLLRKKVSLDELDSDIAWILHQLARTNSKGQTEDDYNDHVRNMLLSKKYEVKDQTREGVSSSGIGAGELDLVIEDKGLLFSIIEAMKLNSVSSDYINQHYKKLITNYNPLQVKRTFLVTYYGGGKFNEWWDRYTNHIKDLGRENLDLPNEIGVGEVESLHTPYISLKKLVHHFTIGDEHFACIHYAVKF